MRDDDDIRWEQRAQSNLSVVYTAYGHMDIFVVYMEV